MAQYQFKAGDPVTWLRTQRGGYGYTIPVKAWFALITPAGKAHIIVEKTNGTSVTRYVNPANLRPRQLEAQK